MKKNLLAGLIATLCVSGVSAFEPFTVKDIRVVGIQRTEAGTVFSYFPVKVGETARRRGNCLGRQQLNRAERSGFTRRRSSKAARGG